MKRKKAALYNPYLDTLGGGEKHILSLLKVLDDEDTEITVFWNHDLTEDIREKFNLRFKHLSFAPNIFKKKSVLKKIGELRKFDYFFYVTDGSYFISGAKKNYIFAMVPDERLYQQTFVNRLKIFNYRFFCNSQFTQMYLSRFGIKADICYPFIEDRYVGAPLSSMKKENIILSVARFFPQLHTKKHDVLIKTFMKLKAQNPKLKDYKLVLAGGLMKEDKAYFDNLKKLAAADDHIVFYPNLKSNQLFDLYKKARFFWHFTGYGENDQEHPERVEHLGISPIEAMAMGCITFCFDAGGPKEIIEDGKTGYLFETVEELATQMTEIMASQKKRETMRMQAKRTVAERFSYPVFRKRVDEII